MAVVCGVYGCADIMLAAEGDLVGEAKETMKRATEFMRSISTEGGYVSLYSEDLKERSAERPTRASQIAIQSPGTPSMGMAFLRAYEVTGDACHLEAAREAASALGRCRLASGGWHATADFDPAYPNLDGRLYGGDKYVFGQIIKHTIHTTFDDNTTQGAIRFLMALAKTTKGLGHARDGEVAVTLDEALKGMLRAQYPNGAWPQCYSGKAREMDDFPIKPAHVPEVDRRWPNADYTGYYTLNDDCHNDCLSVMLEAWKALGKAEYLESVRRGAEFLMLAQLPEPQPGWAQQYDFDMAPAWARSHEMPSVSSCESAGAMTALMDVYEATGEKRYLEAAGRAAGWLSKVALEPRLWARLYELKTDRPVFGDSRGEIFYELADIEPKSRNGYSWISDFKIPEVLVRWERLRADGKRDEGRKRSVPSKGQIRELEKRVRMIIDSLNEKGCWVVAERWRKGEPPEPSLSTRAFAVNMGILAEYLAAVGAQGK